MRSIHHLLVGGLATALLLATPAHSEEEFPTGADVIVRGRSDLADALAIGARPAFDRGQVARAALLVVDVTPYTAAAEERLQQALIQLDSRFPGDGRWSIAPLGGKVGVEVARPSGLAPQLGQILRRDTPTVNTMRSLRETLRGYVVRNAAIVYLADWHFEDDDRIERFIESRARRGQTFSVIGSEAAYLRGWNDGFFPPDRGTKDGLGGQRMYDADIGRNPFGGNAEGSPWHGGDTAYPHLPSYFSHRWNTRFPADRIRVDTRYGNQEPRSPFEDTRERLARIDDGALERYSFTLPSAFGPYGLMRIAYATGGRYVLWSWNPSGRSDVRYDFARVDLLAPDLRPRAAIRKDVPRRALSKALMEVWHTVASRKIDLTRTTPPLHEDLRTPREMVEVNGALHLSYHWRTRRELREFRDRAPEARRVLKGAIKRLDRADAASPAVPDDVDRRLLADLRLFRHALATVRFQIGEALAASRGLPSNAWDREDEWPGVNPKAWVRETRDPDRVRPKKDVDAFDDVSGERLMEARRAELRRYAGTPQGEQIGRNDIYTYRVIWWRYGSGKPSKESPAESPSASVKTPATPGGGSGAGAGPATGK